MTHCGLLGVLVRSVALNELSDRRLAGNLTSNSATPVAIELLEHVPPVQRSSLVRG